jgi:hypothetical protein
LNENTTTHPTETTTQARKPAMENHLNPNISNPKLTGQRIQENKKTNGTPGVKLKF